MADAKLISPLRRPPQLHAIVLEELRNYIQQNRLQPGDPLPPESELAARLGVGRNSVREAIKALESLGILEVRRGIGVFVKKFSFQPLLDNLGYGLGVSLRDVEELRDIRRVLETGLIHRTIEVISEEELAALRAVTETMRERAERGESFAEQDQQFHQLLFRCQNNTMLVGLIDVFWRAFYAASNFANLRNSDPMVTWRDHHEIVEAIAAKDVERARARLDAHYAGIMQIIELNKQSMRTAEDETNQSWRKS